MDLSNAKRDSRAVEGGRWITDIPGMEDLRLRVRGQSSPTVIALRARKQRKVARSDRDETGVIKPDVEMHIFGEVLAEAVLLEWEGLTDNGTPVPYDKELAKKLCTEPDYVLFADAVTWASNVVDRTTAEAQEVLEKNSQKSSRGTSSSAPTAQA